MTTFDLLYRHFEISTFDLYFIVSKTLEPCLQSHYMPFEDMYMK